MISSPRLKQDAVIGMAILVVILALWRLHSRPKLFGKVGTWAQTNIFGASTMSLFPGGQGGGEGDGSGSITSLTGSTNPAGTRGTNPPTQFPTSSDVASQISSNAPPSSNTAAASLANSNEPVIVIALEPDTAEGRPVNQQAAAAMEKNLKDAGARGGDIQLSLSWHNYNDLDLHCFAPGDEEISYNNRTNTASKGILDIDRNYQTENLTLAPVENIYWPVGAAPPGQYRVSVVHYAQRSPDPTPFVIRTIVLGKTNYFQGAITYGSVRIGKPVCAFIYDPVNSDPAQRVRFVAPY